jgi:hypothetical protein
VCTRPTPRRSGPCGRLGGHRDGAAGPSPPGHSGAAAPRRTPSPPRRPAVHLWRLTLAWGVPIAPCP